MPEHMPGLHLLQSMVAPQEAVVALAAGDAPIQEEEERQQKPRRECMSKDTDKHS